MIIITKYNIKQSEWEHGKRDPPIRPHPRCLKLCRGYMDRFKDSVFSMPEEEGGVNEGLGEGAYGRVRGERSGKR